MSEYVIINKTEILERIEELEKERKKSNRFIDITRYTTLDNLIKQLQNILSQSTPLIPEIEKAFDAGSAYAIGTHKDFKQTHPDRKDYPSNLKLDI